VELAVADTGCGIEAEALPHVFDPFFTTKDVGKGTGLGLASVHGIVHQSGGRVEVESTIGSGTTFRVLLPAVEGAAEGQSRPEEGTSMDASATVLVVEDNTQVREVVTEILRIGGYRVLEAENGDAALRLVEGAGPTIDLLITDIVMRGLSGWEVAARMSDRIPGLRTVFVSGFNEDHHVHEGIRAGTPFLQKPFSADELLAIVADTLDNRRI
jgi:two-component system cell cycle sensor histidine kinase/response regulator CckA